MGYWPLLVNNGPHISQGSVSTLLRCGGTFYLQCVWVKEYRKSISIG